jgi:ribonuclease HI
VPRGGTAAGGAEGKVVGAKGAGGYAAYVKQHFAEVKAELPPGSNQKDVMVALGKKYRAEKAELEAASKAAPIAVDGEDEVDEVLIDEHDAGVANVDDLINELEIVTLSE